MSRRGRLRSSGSARQRKAPAELIEVSFDSMAVGGAAVGRAADGRVVLVHGALPGERAQVRCDLGGKRRSRGELVALLETSSSRRDPPCPHASRCGCDWMHISESAQHDFHLRRAQDLVAEAYRDAGRSEDAPHVGAPDGVVLRHHVVEPALGGRARARLWIRGHQRHGTTIGYRARHSDGQIALNDQDCPILVPQLREAIGRLRQLFEGFLGDADASVALGDRQLPVIAADVRGQPPAALWSRVQDAIDCGVLAGASIRLDGATEPATFGDPRPRLMGVDGIPLVISAAGFAQPSETAGALIAERACALAEPRGRFVVELFAGSGTLTVGLAREAGRLLAVESFPEAVVALRENLERRQLSATVIEKNAETFEMPAGVDVVVLDPPRAGAKNVVEALSASRVAGIVYVSCDPGTLRRDLAILLGAERCRYDIDTVEVVEQFRQTSHTEILIRCRRSGARK